MKIRLAVLLLLWEILIISGCVRPSSPNPSLTTGHATASAEDLSKSGDDNLLSSRSILTSEKLSELVAVPDTIEYYRQGKLYNANDKINLIHQEVLSSFDDIMEEYTIANVEGEETEKAVASGSVLKFKYKKEVRVCWMSFKGRRAEFATDAEGEAYFENELKDDKMNFTYHQIIFVLDGGESHVGGMLFIGNSYNAIGKISATETLQAALNEIIHFGNVQG